MADENKGESKFSLKKIFNKAVEVVTIGLASAVCWQLFLDPLFFLPIHDPTNTTMQAWVKFMNEWFGWIPEAVGAKGEGGILHWDVVQDNILSPYMDQVTTVPVEQNTDMSMSGILQP